MPIVRTLCIHMSKDMRIGYFSKPEGVREQKRSEYTVLEEKKVRTKY